MSHIIPRTAVEDRLYSALESEGRLLFLVGPRGSGKTFLLRNLRTRLGTAQPAALIQVEPLVASPEILTERFLELAQDVLRPAPAHLPPFERLLVSVSNAGASGVLLLDELIEVRTLSYFPGIDKPLEGFLTALTRARFLRVLATTRFPSWLTSHLKGLPDLISSRMEVIALPPVSPAELAAEGYDDPELLIAVTGGYPAHLAPLLQRVVAGEDLEEALVHEIRSGGRLEAECRATLAELLHRARGYGACKAVLVTLTEEEGLTLSEIARRMRRTAGSTRDYLRWLEEVELIESRDKRFYFVHPMLRLWLQIYARGRLPSHDEVRQRAEAFLERPEIETRRAPKAQELNVPPPQSTTEEELIEID